MTDTRMSGYWYCDKCKSKVSVHGVVNVNGFYFHTKGDHPVRWVKLPQDAEVKEGE